MLLFKSFNFIKILNQNHSLFKLNQYFTLQIIFQKVNYSRIVPIQDIKFTENDYLLSVLKFPTNSFEQLGDINSRHSNEFLHQFLNLSPKDDLYKVNFNNITSQLIRDLKDFTKNDLKAVLQKLVQDVSSLDQEWLKNTDQYSVLWNHIDHNLSQKLNLLTTNDFLKASTFQECVEICYFFYLLKVPRISKYINLFVQKIEKLNLNPSKSDFIKIMFIINLSRCVMSPSLKTWAQKYFLNFISELSIEEIAVISSAFFKTQTPFSDYALVEKIMKRTIEDIELISSAISLSCILKAIGYSKISPPLALTKSLTFKCLNNFKNLNFTNVNHLSTLIVNHHYYCPEFIDLALSSMEAHVNNLRIKEIERIIKACVHFNHLQPPYKEIHNIIEKRKPMIEEDSKYFLSFSSLLRNLTVFEIYPEFMIKKFLDPNFIEKVIAETKGTLHLHILTLRDAIKLECYPKYEQEIRTLDQIIPQLSSFPVHFSSVSMKDLLSSKPTKLFPNEKLLIRCYLSIKETYKDQVICKNILSFTHFPEIVITSENSGLKQLDIFEFRPISIKNCTVVVIQYKSHFNDETCEHYLGLQRLRTRLLLKLGFNVVHIPYYEVVDLNRKQLIRYFNLKLNVPIKG